MSFVFYSALAGISGSLGSFFGKASGSVPDYYQDLFIIRHSAKIALFVLMLAFNVLGVNFYAKSLQCSPATLVPTLISSAFNYIFSAFIGRVFFHEEIGVMWWLGTLLVFFGLFLIVGDNEKEKNS